MPRSLSQVALVSLALTAIAAIAGCASAPDGAVDATATESTASAIIGGTPATAFPEAVLIEFREGDKGYVCSGALVAPRVVLTAGHCVAGSRDFRVTAPYALVPSRRTGAGSEVLDYPTGMWGQSKAHDLGLVYLDAPIALRAYPALASEPVAAGTMVVNVGRVKDDKMAYDGLFVSAPHAVQVVEGGGVRGFLDPTMRSGNDYRSGRFIQGGDSGGPVELVDLEGRDGHTIVAVNSASNHLADNLTRVDLVHDWLQRAIDGHR